MLSERQVRASELSQRVIGAGIEVHRALGAGLLESAYKNCLCRELALRQIPFSVEHHLPLEYKGLNLECGYRIDILVGGLLIVELKSVEKLQPIHEVQLLTYLRLTNLWLGLLMNFNTITLKEGIRRVVN